MARQRPRPVAFVAEAVANPQSTTQANPKFRLDNRNWRISGESICWLPHSAFACGKVRLILEFSLEEAPAAWTLAGASRSFGVLARGQLPILAEALLHSYDDKFPASSAWSNNSGVQTTCIPSDTARTGVRILLCVSPISARRVVARGLPKVTLRPGVIGIAKPATPKKAAPLGPREIVVVSGIVPRCARLTI